MADEIKKYLTASEAAQKTVSTLWLKLRKIAVEIFIIVFGVSVSIWLNNWSEHRSHQKEVKEFLADLKEDLKTDTMTMAESKKSCEVSVKSGKYILDLTDAQIDSFSTKNPKIDFEFGLVLRKTYCGNYEGFKSSGKIGFIENKKLKKLILEYYQAYVPELEDIEKFHNTQVVALAKQIRIRSTKFTVFKNLETKSNLTFSTSSAESLVKFYESSIKEVKEIMEEMDKEGVK